VSQETDRRRITILGSTGSIGLSALEVVRQYPERFEVVAIAAHSNVSLLAQQIEEFSPSFVAITDEAAADELRHFPANIVSGTGCIEEIAAKDVDIVLCAMVGAVGLNPILKAIDAGNHVAVANKEPFVMAGQFILERAREQGVNVLPVDSEHSAIFQCLQGNDQSDIACIHLTASGGPFYGKPRETLANVTPAQATKHPTWDTGAKISVDSATLMNKGLEIIEAMILFQLRADQVDVVIHPQSIIHSFVEFKDGNILAHLGVTDMKFPILFALTYPKRVEYPMARLPLAEMQALTFTEPDFSAFPCLALAREAAERGGTAPAILNAANEIAVDAFCQDRLRFLGISEVVAAVLHESEIADTYTLDEVIIADEEARNAARAVVTKLGTK
jgi:1-deoxy-D-xylulose-5-phosphate reductoisomerase